MARMFALNKTDMKKMTDCYTPKLNKIRFSFDCLTQIVSTNWDLMF